MVLYAVIGMVLSRWWLRGPQARSVLLPGAVGDALLVVAAAMLAAEQAGRIDLVPYSGTRQETLLIGSVVLAGVWHGVVRRQPWRKGPIEGLVATLSARAGPRVASSRSG